MCLEDRFLTALYDQHGFIPVSNLSNQLSLTETALISIVHRVAETHPDFVRLQGEEPNLQVSPNVEGAIAVKEFLAEGGFTAINEAEFLKYYHSELSLYTKLQDLKESVVRLSWVRWAAMAGLLTGFGVGMARYARRA